ncbi:MAG: hypothetical protein KAJ75_07890, partial [Alphaproteobacteria bacterium]|nr:hypothetical protein [Alphaproteobacteria bacterium]
PKMKVTITTPEGVETIVNGEVLDGATKQPYVYQRTAVVGIGEYEDDGGCNRYELQEEREIYERADGTTYTAEGTPAGRGTAEYVCSSVFQHRSYNKGGYWRTNEPPAGICMEGHTCSCYPDFHTLSSYGITPVFEGLKVFEDRTKKTNNYTGAVFYTNWRFDYKQEDCSFINSNSGVLCGVSGYANRRTDHICNEKIW